MPMDFTSIGLNVSLPADRDILTYRGPIPAFTELRGHINHRIRNGKFIFVPHNPSYSSQIIINGVDYFVVSHIGSGSYGAIAHVRSATGDYVLKIQQADNDEEARKCMKEAMINHIFADRFPAFCNKIYTIRQKRIGGIYYICYLLEKLDTTVQQDIQAIGNPAGPDIGGFTPRQVQTGDYIKPLLCTTARGLERIYTEFQGNHGDLHCGNIMNNKIIDYGFSRLNYEGVLIECDPQYNNRSSESRDLTVLTWALWADVAHECSIKDSMRAIIDFPNPDPTVFSVFSPWSSMMCVKSGVTAARRAAAEAAAAGQHPDVIADIGRAATLESTMLVNTGAIYKYFNSFDNPNGTFAAVKAAMCLPPPPPPPRPLMASTILTGGRGRRLKRRGRITRRDGKKSGRRTRRN
jgi:hypothetical protein